MRGTEMEEGSGTITYGAFGATGKIEKVVQSDGFLNDWFFNMFAATLDITSPLFVVIHIVAIAGLIGFRTLFENPVKFLGCALAYIYAVLQTFALFRDTTYVVDYSAGGAEAAAAGGSPGGVFKI